MVGEVALGGDCDLFGFLSAFVFVLCWGRFALCWCLVWQDLFRFAN